MTTNNSTNTTKLTAKGDLLTFNGTASSRFPVGTDTQVIVANSAAGNGLTWITSNILNSNTINTTPLTTTQNNSYITNNGSTQVNYVLPTTATAGSYIQIVGESSGGWTLTQNAGQTIHFPSVDTTTGTGGSVTSNSQYCCLELICVVANTSFVVLNSTGILTVV